MGESDEASNSASSATSPIGSSLNIQTGSKTSELSVSLGTDKSKQLPGEFVTNASEEPLQSENSDDTDAHVSESSSCPETQALTPAQSTKVEDYDHSVLDASNAETTESLKSSVQKIVPASVEDAMWPVSAFTVAPTLDTDKPEEVPMIKLPRPRSPLVDAVAAHDRRTNILLLKLPAHRCILFY
ncbi:hypothetical protein YC2023_036354 [Brassica napus]